MSEKSVLQAAQTSEARRRLVFEKTSTSTIQSPGICVAPSSIQNIAQRSAGRATKLGRPPLFTHPIKELSNVFSSHEIAAVMDVVDTFVVIACASLARIDFVPIGNPAHV